MKKSVLDSYKGIIFDLDGTLIDSLPYHFLAFKDLLLEHGVRVDDDYLKELMGMSTKKILSGLKKKHKFKESVEDLYEERRYHYFKFLGRKKIVFPGVQKKLEGLRLNWRMAIATGSSLVVFEHSTDKNFQELFDGVVTINEVKKGKPFPDQMLAAARKLCLKPRDCVVVGDSIYDGIAAKRAGMDFIGVTSGYTTKKELMKVGAVKVFGSVKEIN